MSAYRQLLPRRVSWMLALLTVLLLVCGVSSARASSAGPVPVTAGKVPVTAGKVPVTAGKVAAPPGSPLHQLDFLLGRVVCSLSTGPTLITVTRPILNGTYYQIDMTVDRSAQHGTDTHGRWVLSWSSARAAFFSYYYDDQGLHGESASAGRQGDRLTFLGPYDFGGATTHQIRDEFTVLSDRHFTIEEYLQVADSWRLLDIQDCWSHNH